MLKGINLIKKTWQRYRKWYSTVTLTDRIASFALAATVFSIVFSVVQFNEARRQFNEVFSFQKQLAEDDDLKTTQRFLRQSAYYDSQIAALRQQTKLQQHFYSEEIRALEKKILMDAAFNAKQIANADLDFNQQKEMFESQKAIEKEYRKLSFKPLLYLESYAWMTDTNVGIILSNQGLGPATIKKYELYYRGKKVQPQELSEILAYYFKNEDIINRWDCIEPEIGCTIAPGRSTWLLHSPSTNVKDGLMNRLSHSFNRDIGIVILYQSFFGEIDSLVWNKKGLDEKNFR